MKVLVIDPWCTKGSNLESYTIGLCEGLADKVTLTLCCGFYEECDSKQFDVKKFFFRLSDTMKDGYIRKIIRGIEYCIAYCKIIGLASREKFDVIHIEWALWYALDIRIFSILKKLSNKMIYTAHNVIPHINGEKYIEQLRKLHSVFDNILVHGESIKEEFVTYFPEYEKKIEIQYHGVYFNQTEKYDVTAVDEKLKKFVNNCTGKLCVCPGLIFYNKGTDRIIRYWMDYEKGNNCLIVAGKYEKKFTELDQLLSRINDYDNILFIPRFLNDDEFRYLLMNSDIISIPYRHASMSGIVYSAAFLSKPIAYTDTGALKEYFGENCGFRISNDDFLFFDGMKEVMKKDKSELKTIGINFHEWIYINYTWESIAKNLVKNTYQK
ncbi:MAG: glycosyltransferase family 4 protein [Lachnospiraceae bacterium]|nr:glycosyltransferase family 4 protein [Lachnospiraceae bacterium]